MSKLAEGDTFILRILDETLTYEVDQIRTVEPYELDDLGIEEGKDYCTLVTCTPYGINTHRLLVRGRRVDNQPEARTVRVTADAMQIEPVLVAPLVAVPDAVCVADPAAGENPQEEIREGTLCPYERNCLHCSSPPCWCVP